MKSDERERLPEWARRPPGSARAAHTVKRILRSAKLNTVCEEARCPNITDCFSRKTATFMILGDVCTRGCRFCAVSTGRPHMPAAGFAQEAERVAESAEALGLRYVVVTSVARDDLEDGGASGFMHTIHALRRRLPGVRVEVLIPDLRGDRGSLLTIVEARPDVLNHNLETVPRLYRRVRPGAGYERSLDLLRRVKEMDPTIQTKTGIMLGLGEEESEVMTLLGDARESNVDIFTMGQYLQPSARHLPVEEYLQPERFDWYGARAREMGFRFVASAPLVRSSYHAEEFAA